MNQTDFSNLNFDRKTRTIPRRWIFMIVTFILFNLIWRWLPSSSVYWIFLLVVMVLTWVASYGWRQALGVIHHLLHKLEQL
ncbi:MAG: hypothetical protein PVF83_11600 [Anaerolineales bacterium]